MFNIIKLGLEQNKFYELNDLRSELESLPPIVFIFLIPIFMLVVVFLMVLLSSMRGKYEYMGEAASLLALLTMVVTFIVTIAIDAYGESKPIPVKDKEAFIKAVEDGGYKGVYFLSDEEEKGEVQYDVRENILYLTKQSMLEENYENVEGEEAEESEEEVEEDLIAVNQQVKKFKKGSKYQTTLVDEGTPNEHMLLVELVVDGTVIKLDEYTYIENQKRYKVERLDEDFVMLKKDSPK